MIKKDQFVVLFQNNIYIQMKIIKNVLTEKELNKLQELMLNTTFPWYYNAGKSSVEDNNFQFVHIFFWEEKILSPFWNYIAPILDKLKVKKIIRVKANLTTKKMIIINQKCTLILKLKNLKQQFFIVILIMVQQYLKMEIL